MDEAEGAKKKKKKKSKMQIYLSSHINTIEPKKKKEELKVEYAPREQDNSMFRLLGSWKPEGDFKQTYPPTIPIS